jgi:N,N'-diacetylchitobiose transport system permease protein
VAGVLEDHLPAAQADLPGAAAPVGDLGLRGVHPLYILTGSGANLDEYNLGIYVYQRAFSTPPSYGLGGALALVLTAILLIITVGYVRASIKQGALR